jgi:hypothetical protein
MMMEEIWEWIAARDIAKLYYTRAGDINGPYFATYGAATGDKAFIEGYVNETYTTYGTRVSNTSRGVDPRGLEPTRPLAIGQFSHIDHDDGRYTVRYNVTRAGLYSLAVMNMGQLVYGAPFTFMVKPQVFEPSTCMINGTGAPKDKDPVSGKSDYRAALVSGTSLLACSASSSASVALVQVCSEDRLLLFCLLAQNTWLASIFCCLYVHVAFAHAYMLRAER